jgi:hypothetical protein
VRRRAAALLPREEGMTFRVKSSTVGEAWDNGLKALDCATSPCFPLTSIRCQRGGWHVAPSPSDLGAVVELDSWGGAPERRTAAVAERGDERVGLAVRWQQRCLGRRRRAVPQGWCWMRGGRMREVTFCKQIVPAFINDKVKILAPLQQSPNAPHIRIYVA